MNRYKYLIVGGGMAADAAVQGIREVDKEGSIGILSKDFDPPYQRPPLSKDLWKGEMRIEEVDCGTAKYDVDILTGRTVQKLNVDQKTVTDQDRVYSYEKLLLATGGRPKQLPFEHTERAVFYRSLDDFRTVLDQVGECEHFAVVGGGFIGCEMTAALTIKGKKVTMVFPENSPGFRVFPEEISLALAEYYEAKGVKIMSGLKTSDMVCDENGCDLTLENGKGLKVGGVIVGIGIQPNIELAGNAGLETDAGIVVNRYLQTTDESIYSAGDVAQFYNPIMDETLRVEHEDHALTSGKTAGRNMAGKKEMYDHLPFFYSDLFDVGYEAVGRLDSSLETRGIWNGLEEKGIWLYLDKGFVRGVLLWNLFGQTDVARQLIENGSAPDQKELQQLMDAKEDAA